MSGGAVESGQAGGVASSASDDERMVLSKKINQGSKAGDRHSKRASQHFSPSELDESRRLSASGLPGSFFPFPFLFP